MTFAAVPLMLATALTQAVAPSQTLEADQVMRAVQQELAMRLAAKGSSAQVSVLGRIQNLLLPSGHVRIEVGEVPGRWPRARASVPIRIWVDDRAVRSAAVWVSARDERAVLVYADDHAAHAPVDGARTAVKIVDMVCCSGVPVTHDGELAGRLTRHPVSAGQPVMQSDLEFRPDVMTREPVEIEVVRGGVHILAKGVPLEDGRIGERIRVRTSDSDKAIHALVVAGQKVRVDE